MSLLDLIMVTVFSPVRGAVQLNGVPREQVRIEQTYRLAWIDSTRTREIKIKEDGSFEADEIKRFMILGKILPHEPGIDQSIIAHFNGQSHVLWRSRKSNYKFNGELDGESIFLNCDLSSKNGRAQYFNSYSYVESVCDLGFPFDRARHRYSDLISENADEIKGKINKMFLSGEDAGALNDSLNKRYRGVVPNGMRLIGVRDIDLGEEHNIYNLIRYDEGAEFLFGEIKGSGKFEFENSEGGTVILPAFINGKLTFQGGNISLEFPYGESFQAVGFAQ